MQVGPLHISIIWAKRKVIRDSSWIKVLRRYDGFPLTGASLRRIFPVKSRVRDPLGTRYEFGLCGPGRGCYIGAVTRMGVRFRGVNVTDVYSRGVNVNLTPLTSKRGALATDARGCSLWRYLLARPPLTWESRVRDPLGTRYEFGLCGPGRGCYTSMFIFYIMNT